MGGWLLGGLDLGLFGFRCLLFFLYCWLNLRSVFWLLWMLLSLRLPELFALLVSLLFLFLWLELWLLSALWLVLLSFRMVVLLAIWPMLLLTHLLLSGFRLRRTLLRFEHWSFNIERHVTMFLVD